MRIAIDLSSFKYGKAPGFNEYILSLLDGLMKCDLHGLKITLYVEKKQKIHFRSYAKYFKIKYLNFPNDIYRFLWTNFILPLNSFYFDIFLFPANTAPFFFPCRYILVIHDLNYISNPSVFSLKNRLFRKIFIPKSIYSASKIISISKSTKQEIFNNFGIESIVIYNPVRHIKSVNLINPSSTILCPSSLAQHKNILSGYYGIVNFLEMNPLFNAKFIGNWVANDFPVTNIHPRIFLLGHVSNQHKKELFQNAKCILIPSIYEGFGIPYVEALIEGKALICSRIPVAEEVVGNYPYWIEPPYDSESVCHALILAQYNDFTPKGDLSSLRFKFNPSNIAQQYLNVLAS